jgi:ADP-ribosylglycohydrolase
LREVVSLGGDTDTNACIVGGMIGALVSEKNIQKNHKITLQKFDCSLKFEPGEG